MNSVRMAAATAVALVAGVSAYVVFSRATPPGPAVGGVPSTSPFIAPATLPAHPALASTNPVTLFDAALDLIESTEDDTDYLDDPHRTAFNAGVEAFLARQRPIVDLLVKAGSLAAVDAREVPTDMNVALKSLNQPRRACALLVLQARYDLQHGRPGDAVNEQVAALALAQYVGQEKLLVARLVECGMEALALESIARTLSQLPRENVEQLRDRFSKLPPPVPTSATLAAERDYGMSMSRRGGGPIPANLPAFYEGIMPAADGTPAAYHAAIAAQLKKFPYDQFLKILAPSLDKMRDPIAATEAKRSMLITAIDITLNGPEAATKSKDPFGNGPFKYEPNAKGFLLSSELVFRETPVTLQVGTAR